MMNLLWAASAILSDQAPIPCQAQVNIAASTLQRASVDSSVFRGASRVLDFPVLCPRWSASHPVSQEGHS